MAEPWGRSVDERLAGLDSRLDLLDSGSANSGRMANSGLDNVASQVSELFARQTSQVVGTDMATIVFGPTSTAPDVVQTIQLPAPDDAERIGWLAVQCAISFSGPDDAYSTGFLTYELDGEMIGAFSYALPFVGASTTFASGDSVFSGLTYQGVRYSPAAYFREMNIPTALLEDMQRIEPRNMRVLSPADLARYRLN